MVARYHGLMPCGRQIDNRQAAMADTHIALNPVAFAVGTPVNNGVGHSLQYDGRNRLAIKIDISSDTTHSGLMPPYMLNDIVLLFVGHAVKKR